MYEHISRSNWRRHSLFILADLLGMQVSFVLAFYIRMGDIFPYDEKTYLMLSLGLLVISLLVSTGTNTYSEVLSRGMLIEFRSTFGYVTIVMMIMVAVLFVTKGSASFSRIVIVLIWLFSMVINTLLRILVKGVKRRSPLSDAMKRQIILVSTAKSVKKSSKRAASGSVGDFISFAGVAILDTSGEENDDLNKGGVKEGDDLESELPIVAYGEELIDFMNRNVVDAILVDESANKHFTPKMMNVCIEMGITVHQELKNVNELNNQVIETIGDTVLLTTSIKVANSRQIFMKRLMDIVGGITGSLITLVILMIVTPVIKIQSPGPVIFRQTRVGKGGRHFTVYKIRTMYADAEERKKELMDRNKMQGLMFKVDNDPRIYPFGNFLRRTSLDEFPQFFNVLKGEMSLVGTRPPTLDEYEQYEYKHHKRLSIKPGITGLWQISGRSEITDFEDIVKLDAEYITSWRLLLDIKILLKTVAVVFRRGGAQ